MPDSPVNLFEFEPLAKERLEQGHYDFIAGAALDELTMRRTRAAFDAIALRPRMLAGVAAPEMTVNLLGQRASLPVFLAPTGGLTRAHPQGELEAARAAAGADTIMCVSANGSFTLEEIAGVADGPRWFQSYIFQDREFTLSLASRAAANRYGALILTLDAHWPPKRERDIRNDYQRAPGPNYAAVDLKRDTGSTTSPRPTVDPRAIWKDVDWFCSQTALPVVLKGIVTREDAALAVEHGVDAVIVSNHGGRNVDSTLATIEALPEVVEAVDGRIPVLLDGGIRRGADVVKALALGASSVLVGRPVFWGLGWNGQDGVRRMLEILREELHLTMRSIGAETVADIGPACVTRVPL